MKERNKYYCSSCNTYDPLLKRFFGNYTCVFFSSHIDAIMELAPHVDCYVKKNSHVAISASSGLQYFSVLKCHVKFPEFVLSLQLIFLALFHFSFFHFFIKMFRCHGPKPPPNPEFTLKPKKRKSNHQAEGTPGSPCPPCSELLWRSCVGQHIGTERMVGFITSYKQYMDIFNFHTLFACLPLRFYYTTVSFCPQLFFLIFLLFRWSARIEKNFLVKICVGIFFLVAITIVLKLAMP